MQCAADHAPYTHNGETTTIVLKGTNWCPPGNPLCENGRSHFDIAAPGFDYPNASLTDDCKSGEPGESALQRP